MEALEAERLRIRDDLAARIAAADLNDREIAEIYWRFPAVPVASPGIAEDVLRIAREHPWWS